MKGVILAGGLGTRLHPLTKITNKHLLPIYDRPMICYPISTLLKAGIDDVLLVTGGEHAGDFLRLLGNGRGSGLKRLSYTYQEGEGGIAEALGLAEDFADGDDICVILGDNYIEDNLADAVQAFNPNAADACIFLKQVRDPERFGVAKFFKDGSIECIVEKPKEPPSDYAVTGIYMYDSCVFDIIKKLKPSDRGELEISDVNNAFIYNGTLKHTFLEGNWSDAGTFESLLRATLFAVGRSTLDDVELKNIGADIAADKLRVIAETGKHPGVFGGEKMEAAAQAILKRDKSEFLKWWR